MHRIRLAAGLAAVATLFVASSAGLHADELRRRGLIGIQVMPVSPEAAEAAGMEAPRGIGIGGVFPDTGAAAAGLQSGDIVVKIADQDVVDLQGFMKIMSGYFAGDTVPFTVMREKEKQVIPVTLGERPRETSEDYDVIYGSAKAKDYKIRTIITKPKADGKRPAVLIMAGPAGDAMEFSDPRAANHPFKKFIDALTSAGIVTIRAHVIGAGDSEGPSNRDLTLENEIASQRAALASLKSLDYVDANNVFIFGHGMGATIAPLVADGENVKGVITYAAFSRPLPASLRDTIIQLSRLEARDEADVIERGKQMEMFAQHCFVDGETPANVLKEYPDMKPLIEPFIQNDTHVFGRHYRYFQNLTKADVDAAWKKFPAPVLVIWGTADFQSTRDDSEYIVQQVNAAHAGHATYKELNGIDHNFDRMSDQEESYMSGFSSAYNPLISNTVVAWIKDQASS